MSSRHPPAEEGLGIQSAEEQLAVGHRRLDATQSERGRTGPCARTPWAHAQRVRLVDPRDGATTGADRDDVDERRQDRPPIDLGLGPLEDLAIFDQHDIEAGSPDVGAHQVRTPELHGERPPADRTAGGTRHQRADRERRRPRRLDQPAV
jgi:hypothetical protein